MSFEREWNSAMIIDGQLYLKYVNDCSFLLVYGIIMWQTLDEVD